MEKIVRMQIGLMGGVNTNELQEQGEPCFYITPPTLFLSPFHFQLETKLRRPRASDEKMIDSEHTYILNYTANANLCAHHPISVHKHNGRGRGTYLWPLWHPTTLLFTRYTRAQHLFSTPSVFCSSL